MSADGGASRGVNQNDAREYRPRTVDVPTRKLRAPREQDLSAVGTWSSDFRKSWWSMFGNEAQARAWVDMLISIRRVRVEQRFGKESASEWPLPATFCAHTQ